GECAPASRRFECAKRVNLGLLGKRFCLYVGPISMSIYLYTSRSCLLYSRVLEADRKARLGWFGLGKITNRLKGQRKEGSPYHRDGGLNTRSVARAGLRMRWIA